MAKHETWWMGISVELMMTKCKLQEGRNLERTKERMKQG